MSRIILSKFDSGQERVVVGWDHPAHGAFWQEFSLEMNPDTGVPFYETDEDWEEIKRGGGMWPGIPLEELIESMPKDLRPLMTDKVMDVLVAHRADPNSGYNKGPVDMTGEVPALDD